MAADIDYTPRDYYYGLQCAWSLREDAHESAFTMRLQTAILISMRQEFIEKLNLHSIYPHLYSRGLLPRTLDREELVALSPKMAQVDRVISHVPKCGKVNFLDEFIICLEKSKEGTGGAHEELIDSLQAMYKSKMESLKCTSLESGIFYYIIIRPNKLNYYSFSGFQI
jgi:hypothetical protein